MNERQIGTTLAALRMWQRDTDREKRFQDDIASDAGETEPLNDQEIDELCETLNFDRPRVVLQILNGVVQDATSDGPCDLLIVDRDEAAETELPDGSLGEIWFQRLDGADTQAVDEAFIRFKQGAT